MNVLAHPTTIDRDGNLVDSMLSEHRDMDSAKKFLTQAREVVGHRPARVTTDGASGAEEGPPSPARPARTWQAYCRIGGETSVLLTSLSF